MSNIDTSVVVLNWNGKRFLKNLFDSLAKQTYPRDKYEVIFVDNASKDDSVDFVRDSYPWVRIIKNKGNYGFAKGCNAGMVAARGKYIVLLNNDTKTEPKWLAELVRVADKKKAGAVVSKLMFDKKRGFINNAGGFLQYDKTWPAIEQGINEKDNGQYDRIQEITAFCGASVLFNRKMLEQIGLLDEIFWMYFEDTDLSWRGQKKGWHYYLAPKSVLYHAHAGSSGEDTPLFKFYVSRNRVLILLKNAKLKLALKGFAAVIRDRLWYGLKQLISAIKQGHGRREAIDNLWLGLKVLLSCVALAPFMMLKRAGLIKERRLSR